MDTTTRRQFLTTTVTAVAGVAVAGSAVLASPTTDMFDEAAGRCCDPPGTNLRTVERCVLTQGGGTSPRTSPRSARKPLMTVTCDKCKTEYDDLYRLTYCPHEKFGMMTTIMRPDGARRGRRPGHAGGRSSAVQV